MADSAVRLTINFEEGIRAVRKFWDWLALLWTKPDKGDHKQPHAAKSRRKTYQDYVDGNYTTIRHLLDDLDFWFGALKKLKTSHLDADRLVKNLGIYLPGPMEIYPMQELEGGEDRPMPLYFATTFYSARIREIYKSRDKVPILAYASKTKWDKKLQGIKKPESGWFYDFYLCYYVDGKWFRGNTFVEVSGGSVRLLPFLRSVYTPLPKNGSGTRGYHSMKWSPSLLPWSESCEDPAADTIKAFISSYNAYLRRGCSTEIHATQAGSRIVFSVPEHSWKRFFRDRITAKANDGKRKRIFHHVAAHKRRTGSIVKMHTRGVTEFKWGDANIRIVEQKPGRVSILDAGMISESSDSLTLEKGQMGCQQASQKLLQHTLKRLHRAS